MVGASKTRAFSATGKAIVAGGYLVLDPMYRAFVIALSSRMHAVVATSEAEHSETLKIHVKSPQFKDGEWVYNVKKSEPLAELNGRTNVFVEATVDIVIRYIENSVKENVYAGKVINITIFSDAEYHSQTNSTERKSSNGKFTFLYHDAPISKVNKTGLGSSAGIVTTLTAALFSAFFSDFNVSNHEWKRKVHNLAQISHCKAQGKIGSGFDVASATFGSIFYQRFNPALINELLSRDEADFNAELKNTVDNVDWELDTEACRIPAGFTLLMGDVEGGSETTKMVSKVNNWRLANPEKSQAVWNSLNENNIKFMDNIKQLDSLRKLDPKKYELLLKYVSTHKGDEFVEQTEFEELKSIVESMKQIRENFRLITKESGADIEPKPQTKLLDSCSELKGVIGAVVPGAGGYDAICVLAAKSNVDEIKKQSLNDPRFECVRWMDLEEENEGLIEEPSEDFEGLL